MPGTRLQQCCCAAAFHFYTEVSPSRLYLLSGQSPLPAAVSLCDGGEFTLGLSQHYLTERCKEATNL